MTQYILDTDTLSLLQHGNPQVVRWSPETAVTSGASVVSFWRTGEPDYPGHAEQWGPSRIGRAFGPVPRGLVRSAADRDLVAQGVGRQVDAGRRPSDFSPVTSSRRARTFKTFAIPSTAYRLLPTAYSLLEPSTGTK